MSNATLDESRYGKYIASNVVRFERLLPGPIERVWEYITDSEKRGTWLGTGDVPAKVGAAFETTWENSKLGSRPGKAPEKYAKHDGQHVGKHKVTHYEPPHRLGYDWDTTSGDQSSHVMYELKQQGDKVLLTLTHSRLKKRSDALGVSGGWHTHLDLLSDILHGQDSGSFWENFSKIDGTYEERIPT